MKSVGRFWSNIVHFKRKKFVSEREGWFMTILISNGVYEHTCLPCWHKIIFMPKKSTATKVLLWEHIVSLFWNNKKHKYINRHWSHRRRRGGDTHSFAGFLKLWQIFAMPFNGKPASCTRDSGGIMCRKAVGVIDRHTMSIRGKDLLGQVTLQKGTAQDNLSLWCGL